MKIRTPGRNSDDRVVALGLQPVFGPAAANERVAKAFFRPDAPANVMKPRARQDHSDWPIACMLDELHFRVLRQIVHQMEYRGLWIPKELRAEIIAFRHAYGAHLMQEILLQALGNDYAELGSENVFGLPDHKFVVRAPRSLSFGYDMGTSIHRLLVRDGLVRSEIGKLCALFNFGITIFDAICDRMTDTADLLHRRFDERTLQTLIREPQRASVLEASISQLPSVEARVVLRVICAFFSRLHATVRVPYTSDAWRRFEGLVLEAYRAELSSSNQQSLDRSAIAMTLVASERKSTIPFQIMFQVALICEPSASHSNELVEIIQSLGRTFWLMDDLVDLTEDFRVGGANGILLRRQCDLAPAQDAGISVELLVNLLDSNCIATAIVEMSDSLCELLRRIEAIDCYPRSKKDVREMILVYLCNWLPKRFSRDRQR
jgi:hypothetical protein